MELVEIDPGEILENIDEQKSVRFHEGHRVPGRWPFRKQCLFPDVQPLKAEKKDVRILTEQCQTCGATNAKLERMVVTG